MLESKKMHNFKIMQILYIVSLNMVEPVIFSWAVKKHKE
jgi:hypothetical protein